MKIETAKYITVLDFEIGRVFQYKIKDWDVENEYLIIAPTIGAEYYISDNFSFGGEGMYTMVTNEEEEDTYTTSSKVHMLIPRFIVRFYF